MLRVWLPRVVLAFSRKTVPDLRFQRPVVLAHAAGPRRSGGLREVGFATQRRPYRASVRVRWQQCRESREKGSVNGQQGQDL